VLLDELGVIRPWTRVVGDAQVDAVGDGRMIEEDVDRIGVRIDENGFAVNLEGTCEGLAGIANYAVGDLEAIDIGLMLLITAEVFPIASAANRRESKARGGGDEAQSSTARMPQEPRNAREASRRSGSRDRKERKAWPRRIEIPSICGRGRSGPFVAKIGEDFVDGFLSEGGVPDDDALRGAEAVDGGVSAMVLSLAFIQNMRSGRNFLTSAAGDALEFGDEQRGLGGERFVFVKKRIDHVGRYELH